MATGLTDILSRHCVASESVVFPNIIDWVEAPSPDLCVDRVDYGLREMNRWNEVVRRCHFGVEDFTITPEGMLAMKDPQRARIFSEGYLLLSQEHWGEADHRFLEELKMLQTKVGYAHNLSPDIWVFDWPNSDGLVPLHAIHPMDLMYVTDPAQQRFVTEHYPPASTLDLVMSTIAKHRRQYIWPERSAQIEAYMNQFADETQYAQVVTTGTYKPLPKLTQTIRPAHNLYPYTSFMSPGEAAETSDSESIDFTLHPFKIRQIDPLVQMPEGYRRLSEIDPSYGERLQEHRQQLEQIKVGRLHIPDEATRAAIREMAETIDEKWQARLQNSRRMTPSEFRSLVDASASQIHGQYSFMTFHG